MKEWLRRVVVWLVVITAMLFTGNEANVRKHHVSHSGIRSVALIEPGSFTDSLFEKYGNNGSMNIGQFKKLLKELKIGKADEPPKTSGTSLREKCFSATSMLDVFSLNQTKVDKKGFEKICPAIVQQIESNRCSRKGGDKKSLIEHSKAKAWGFGFLSVTIISCASLAGAVVVPFMSHTFYKKLLMFMVSLAVGVLGGSGIFHLIPSTFGFGKDGDHRYLYKCGVIVGGIYLFFFLEYIMKMYIRFKGKGGGHGHSHGLPNLSNGKTEIADDSIAAIQLEMYNYRQDHNRGHANSFCVSNELNKKLESNLVTTVCSTKRASNISDNSYIIVDGKQPKEVINKKNAIAPVAWMIVIGDAVHNFIDGLAIGAAFSSATIEGISTALAIFCEELPHELGDFAVLLNGGMSYKQAMFFNFLSACSCFLGLVVGLLLGYATSAVKWIYALAGGMFVYISLVDMLQEATEMSFKEGEGSLKKNLKTFALQNFGMLFGFAVMFILALYGPSIKL